MSWSSIDLFYLLYHNNNANSGMWTCDLDFTMLLNRSCIFSPALADIQRFSAKEIKNI